MVGLAAALEADASALLVTTDFQIVEELTYAERPYWCKRLAGQTLASRLGTRMIAVERKAGGLSANGNISRRVCDI